VSNVLGEDCFRDGSRMNGTRHKPLTELKDRLIELDDLLSQFLFQVDPALFEVEEEEFRNVLVNLCRFYDVTVIDDLLQRLE
jgi:hypothetical protein